MRPLKPQAAHIGIENTPDARADLWKTLLDMIKNPLRSIVPPWSWKAAIFSATLRALTFFATNLKDGERVAVRAMLVEAAFAVFTAGLVGAISQQLRRTRPLWATLIIVLICLPGIFIAAQAWIHHAAHTPRIAGGLIAAFLLTSLSSGFSWYAMRHGAMLGGVDNTTIRHDFKSLPGIALRFLLAAPRMLLKLLERARKTTRRAS